jgi:hypothetical protein
MNVIVDQQLDQVKLFNKTALPFFLLHGTSPVEDFSLFLVRPVWSNESPVIS